jgi:SNF family Na+-dependent transporter
LRRLLQIGARTPVANQTPQRSRTVRRERWATRIGLVLALSGNAIGLGNFLRFPRQAALNGGGAFLVPYFVCLLAIGIPLLWIELAIGRYGGARGRGHTASIFPLLWRHRFARSIGALGIFIPFVVATYYVYVESWCLAYAWFSLRGTLTQAASPAEIGDFLAGFQGLQSNAWFDGVGWAYAFFLGTLLLNLAILRGGIARGIERLALVAMPLLFLLGIGLMVRVLSLEPPPGAGPDQSVVAGLGFVWNPDFTAILEPKVWVAAAGQVFFTLSVGWGIVHAYGSYMGPRDDVPLTGLTGASLNEFAEVVLGGTIALTAAVVFFGAAQAQAVAASGSFDLAFQSMPLVLSQLPGSSLFGAAWFLLLFLAGLTSSVALLQPLICLLQEDFGATRERAVSLSGGVLWVCAHPVVFWLGHGFMKELDFWVGELALLTFGLLELVIFGWFFGIDRGWQEITRGAELRVPPFYRHLIRWGLPLALGTILGTWVAHELGPQLSLEAVAAADRPYVIGARLWLAALLALTVGLAHAGGRAAERRTS